MSDIKIEKGIPMPAACNYKKYPFDTMQVGDSFFVSKDKGLNAQQAAYQAGKRLKQKFTSRNTSGGVRIWRVK